MRPIFWFICGVLIAAALNAPFVYAADPLPSIASNGVITYSTDNGARQWMELGKTTTMTGGNVEYNTTPKTFTLGTANGARVPVTIDAVATRVLTPANLAKAGIALLKKNPVLVTGVAADIFSQLDLHYDSGAGFTQGHLTRPWTTTPTTTTTTTSTTQDKYKIEIVGWPIIYGHDGAALLQQHMDRLKAQNPAYCGPSGTECTVTNVYSGVTYNGPYTTYWTRGTMNIYNGSPNYWADGTLDAVKVSGCVAGETWVSGTGCQLTTTTCPSGYTYGNNTCTSTEAAPLAKTEAQVQALLEPLVADPNADPFYQGLDDTTPVNVGNDIPLNPSLQQTPNNPTTVTPPVNGQQTITSPKRVTDQGDGTRKEEQTVINTTTTGDTITYNITNTSNIINNTTGATVSTETSTTTGTPPTPDTAGTFNDTPMPSVDPLIEMPAVPDFYTQKYPDGMAGEWQTFKTTIDQSSLVTTLHAMAPNWSGGECPSWTFNMNTGMVNLGVHDLAPPCWIFPILKIILMVTALFVARGLIFGG